MLKNNLKKLTEKLNQITESKALSLFKFINYHTSNFHTNDTELLSSLFYQNVKFRKCSLILFGYFNLMTSIQ